MPWQRVHLVNGLGQNQTSSGPEPVVISLGLILVQSPLTHPCCLCSAAISGHGLCSACLMARSWRVYNTSKKWQASGRYGWMKHQRLISVLSPEMDGSTWSNSTEWHFQDINISGSEWKTESCHSLEYIYVGTHYGNERGYRLVDLNGSHPLRHNGEVACCSAKVLMGEGELRYVSERRDR